VGVVGRSDTASGCRPTQRDSVRAVDTIGRSLVPGMGLSRLPTARSSTSRRRLMPWTPRPSAGVARRRHPVAPGPL